jgi:hypothetical protein
MSINLIGYQKIRNSVVGYYSNNRIITGSKLNYRPTPVHTHTVESSVVRFFSFLREPPVRFWHLKIDATILFVRVWARLLQNLNPSVPVLSHFFKFKNLRTWFHVHTTHSPMLNIMWVQNFMIKWNRGLCKYRVEELTNFFI